MRTPVTVGVVGLGYWGPNLARAFGSLAQAELTWLCDARADQRDSMSTQYPRASVTADFEDLLRDESLDAIVIATPSSTHSELARAALEADKHVFVEKPLALTTEDADDLVRLAHLRQRSLMVGHVLLHHPAVKRLKTMVDAGALGEIFYIYANRQNLGRVRSDENALWSLGAHDLSVILHLLDDQPIEVSAHGESYVRDGIADVVFCFLRFATGITAHLHLSWLDPHKLRRLTIVGSRQMAVFDDMAPERKLTIFDKSARTRRTAEFGEYVQVQFGDVVSPVVGNEEPLRLECEHFLESVRRSSAPSKAAADAASVVRVLSALQESLDNGGAPIHHGEPPTRLDVLRVTV